MNDDDDKETLQGGEEKATLQGNFVHAHLLTNCDAVNGREVGYSVYL